MFVRTKTMSFTKNNFTFANVKFSNYKWTYFMMKTKWLDGLSNFIFWQVAWKLKKNFIGEKFISDPDFFSTEKVRFLPKKNFRSPIFSRKKDQGPGFFKKDPRNQKFNYFVFLQWRPQMKKKPLIFVAELKLFLQRLKE